MTAIALAGRRVPEVRLSRGQQLGLLVGLAAILYVLFQGSFVRPFDADAEAFRALNEWRDWLDEHRMSPLFALVLEPARLGINTLVDVATGALTGIGWLGVVAIAGAVGLTLVTWRTALLVVAAFVAIGLLGLWNATMITLGQMVVAVALALAIGVPIGIVAGLSDRALRAVTPVLDLMQIMPTFAYLAPLSLLFLIGNATATIATLIYAIPPAIRLTALGIRGVPAETVEAATSLGSTRGQVLRKVQLPMARSTVALAVNQTIMMALAMVVITAFVGAGGLGDEVIRPLRSLDAGASFNAGVAIVLLAMILDRLTAGASRDADRARGSGASGRRLAGRPLALTGLGLAAAGVVLGILLEPARSFPAAWSFSFAELVNAVVGWVETSLAWITEPLKNVVSAWLLDPLQAALTGSPWWLVIGVAAWLAALTTGRRAALAVALAGFGVLALQVWEPAMETLAQVLVGVALTLAVGVTMGTLAARSDVVSQVLRPINDAAQTMPSFVYLLPAVALFGATRFTAILAAVIYAIPVVIRLVEDGVRGVSPTAIEAARSSGSTTLQLVRKVQLPMARRSLLAATNQAVVMVLAMVVVGGLVGAGALGYQVVAGFAQRSNFGSGMASAIAIVLLGVMLDRMTQGAGARRERAAGA